MTLLALVLALSPAGLSPAALPPQPAPPLGVTGQAAERARVHLLHLADGHVLRGRARTVPDGWEIQLRGAWRTLPARSVVRAVPESEALAELRRRERVLPDEDLEARLELCRWTLAEGLTDECLAGLDRLLTEDPDHEEALELLLGGPLRMGLPPLGPDSDEEERHAFFRFAAGLPPAAAELAVRGLVQLADPHRLREVLEAELVDGSPRRRRFAALALRRLLPGRALEPLLTRVVLDASETVRTEAGRALRDADDETLVLPVLRALESEHPLVRTNAAEALGTMGYAAAVPPLLGRLAPAESGDDWKPPAANLFVGRQTALVRDFDVEVAQGSSIADPAIVPLPEGAVLDARVLGASTGSSRGERRAVRRSLARLTGAEPGHTAAAWRRWWDAEGEAWLARARGGADGPVTPAGDARD